MKRAYDEQKEGKDKISLGRKNGKRKKEARKVKMET